MKECLADLTQASAARVIRYDTLCAAPMAQARALFDFAGLAWQPQTASFIARSTTHRGPARYYQVFRDARAAAESWRPEMPRDDQARIAAILRRSCARVHLSRSAGLRFPWKVSSARDRSRGNDPAIFIAGLLSSVRLD